MKLAVPKESHPQETRGAVSPETVKKFRALDTMHGPVCAAGRAPAERGTSA